MNRPRHQLLREWAQAHDEEARAFLAALVNQDSGTFDRAAVNQVVEILAGAYGALGFAVRRIAQERYGDHLEARRHNGRRALLCIGHTDTVYPAGTAALRPYRVVGTRATGPGVLDMKGGLTVMLFALRALAETASPAWAELGLTVFLNADEEVGSPSSGEQFLELARSHQAALVFEPARPNGECVIGRKGVGHFRLEVFGRQAHAGSQPELGVNAICELAHKVLALQALTDLANGTTVNVGVVRGGARSNVVPDYALAEIDLRIQNQPEAERAVQAFRTIAAQAQVTGTTARLTGGITTPPWQTDDGTRRMLRLLNLAGAPLQLGFSGVSTGGGSDGNRTAQRVPTLDGLGPVGSQMHSPEEFLELTSLPERVALMAHFIEVWHERWEA